MQQFIPFEDDWDTLEKLCPETLIPYRVGLLGPSERRVQPTALPLPSILSASSACAPVAVDSSGT